MIQKRGNLIIISAPSGAGKTTLVHALVESVPNLLVSVSHTTRDQRDGEKDGEDYHFIDAPAFEALIKKGEFLEYAEVFNHYYGTSRPWVEQHLAMGNNIILEIDWQGAQQVRKQLNETFTIFILPPSYETLAARLHNRGDDENLVRERMQGAAKELSHYREYDFLVINDDFKTALGELTAIIQAAGNGYTQQKAFYDDFMRELLKNTASIQ